jgi:hypothetical protein
MLDRLGISKPMLEKIEIPLKVIRQAGLIYDVSYDFLLGFSDDTNQVVQQVRDTKLEGKMNALMAVHETRRPESVNRFSGRIFRSSNMDRRRSRWLLLSSLFSS